jgi:CpeT protein
MLAVTMLMMAFVSAVAISRVPDDQDVQEVSSWIEGSYSSEKQSKVDTNYTHQRIEIRRIWMDRTDGMWFTLERFVPGKDSAILEQSVLQIHGVEENLTEVRVFAWKAPSQAVGLWSVPDNAGTFDKADLSLRRGCEWYLQRDQATYFGGTHGMACLPDKQGKAGAAKVSYATTSIRIGDKGMVIWERGYSADNQQILGSDKGPYYYLKQKP